MPEPIYQRYEITWDNTAGFYEGAAPADGFMDHMHLRDYIAAGSKPSSAATSKAKFRAWWRYHRMRLEMCVPESPVDFRVVSNGGATVDSAGTSFVVRIAYAHTPEIDDEFNPGTKLSGTTALRRLAARPFVWDLSTLIDWYDPAALPRQGWFLDDGVAGTPFAGAPSVRMTTSESRITVTQIA